MKLTFREKHAIKTATPEQDYCFIAHGLTMKSLWNKGLAQPAQGFGYRFGAIYELTDSVKKYREAMQLIE